MLVREPIKMMYNLILVLAQGVTTVGTYSDLASCQSHMAQFQTQNVTAACVQQQSPEEALKQAQGIMNLFMNAIPKQ